jgi:hypothetical protein
MISATEAVTELILYYEKRLETCRDALTRIMDVAERYQENNTSRGSVGLGNCYRFARHALETEAARAKSSGDSAL